MFNVFRDLGDFLHLFAIILLLVKFIRTKSCANISGKTQILHAIVFMMRYLDVFETSYGSYSCCYYYITSMKVAYVLLSLLTVYMIYGPYKKTYDRENDTVYNDFLIVPCIVLATFLSSICSPIEFLWTFSVFLEAVAIVPQLDLLCKIDYVDNYTTAYLIPLGMYRVLYILNWGYRYHYEGYYDQNSVYSGFLMAVVFALVFVRLYILKRREHRSMITIVE
ncbi:AAEL005926-PB [Aedes aegypti]|uniref:AAEL005926-PA n=2 Tax=Aedes aegypti TaxID=7159 RepID=A6KVE1_AEDAE|nr:ER lumen protein-retaining receptor 3 [Aedes aegypti]EAT42549.1 AAEL005926-PA [Aedes aegypti]EAT42550.1 AAEL005926-PC [Aedes aegypti]EAT42551.1 AAEL005926-PB [Aedes aegypti]